MKKTLLASALLASTALISSTSASFSGFTAGAKLGVPLWLSVDVADGADKTQNYNAFGFNFAGEAFAGYTWRMGDVTVGAVAKFGYKSMKLKLSSENKKGGSEAKTEADKTAQKEADKNAPEADASSAFAGVDLRLGYVFGRMHAGIRAGASYDFSSPNLKADGKNAFEYADGKPSFANHLTGDFGAFFEYQVMPSFVVGIDTGIRYSFADVKASDIKGWDDAKKANPNAKDATLYKSPMDWNVSVSFSMYM